MGGIVGSRKIPELLGIVGIDESGAQSVVVTWDVSDYFSIEVEIDGLSRWVRYESRGDAYNSLSKLKQLVNDEKGGITRLEVIAKKDDAFRYRVERIVKEE